MAQVQYLCIKRYVVFIELFTAPSSIRSMISFVNILDIIVKIYYSKIVMVGEGSARFRADGKRRILAGEKKVENFVIVLACFSICLIFVALALLINGSGAQEQKLLIFIMCGTLVQNVGYLLDLTAPTLEAAVAAVTVENVGSAFVPLCYCWFIYAYCYASPPKKLLGILGAINFLVLPTVFFNWNGLFYQEFQWLSTENGFQYISIAYGPLYGLFMVTRIAIPYECLLLGTL